MEVVSMMLKDMSNEDLLKYKNTVEKKVARYSNLQTAKKVCL